MYIYMYIYILNLLQVPILFGGVPNTFAKRNGAFHGFWHLLNPFLHDRFELTDSLMLTPSGESSQSARHLHRHSAEGKQPVLPGYRWRCKKKGGFCRSIHYFCSNKSGSALDRGISLHTCSSCTWHMKLIWMLHSLKWQLDVSAAALSSKDPRGSRWFTFKMKLLVARKCF